MKVFVGDFVDGYSTSEALKQVPASDHFSPSVVHFPFEDLGLGSGPVTAHAEHGIVKVGVVFKVGFKGGH